MSINLLKRWWTALPISTRAVCLSFFYPLCESCSMSPMHLKLKNSLTSLCCLCMKKCFLLNFSICTRTRSTLQDRGWGPRQSSVLGPTAGHCTHSVISSINHEWGQNHYTWQAKQTDAPIRLPSVTKPSVHAQAHTHTHTHDAVLQKDAAMNSCS
mgnify:CR=1 FL=1